MLHVSTVPVIKATDTPVHIMNASRATSRKSRDFSFLFFVVGRVYQATFKL